MDQDELRRQEEEVRQHIPEVMQLSGPDGVQRHYRLVRVVDRGRWLLRADEDGSEAHGVVGPQGIRLFTEESADAFLAEAARYVDRRDRSTANAPRGGYHLNPVWIAVVGAGAWATWRLYEGGVDWWWTALVATLAAFWAAGITHNYRHDPDRLPAITGVVGMLGTLGCVGLLVASFLVPQ